MWEFYSTLPALSESLVGFQPDPRGRGTSQPPWQGACCRPARKLKRGFINGDPPWAAVQQGPAAPRRHPDVHQRAQHNNDGEVRRKGHQPGPTWASRPPDNQAVTICPSQVPGGGLSAAPEGGEGQKSGSEPGNKHSSQIAVKTIKLPICPGWSSRGARAARAPQQRASAARIPTGREAPGRVETPQTEGTSRGGSVAKGRGAENAGRCNRWDGEVRVGPTGAPPPTQVSEWKAPKSVTNFSNTR